MMPSAFCLSIDRNMLFICNDCISKQPLPSKKEGIGEDPMHKIRPEEMPWGRNKRETIIQSGRVDNEGKGEDCKPLKKKIKGKEDE